MAERALARTGRANDADDLAGRDIQAEIAEHLRTVDAIAEVDMLESDLTANGGKRRAPGTIGRLGRGVEDVAETFHRKPGLMKILPQLGEPQHRGGHAGRQHVERHELADRQASIDHEPCAEIQQRRHVELVDELHALACHVAEVDDPEACRNVAGELFFPAPLHLRLDGHRLERLDACDAFHQKRLVLCAALEFFVQPVAKQRRGCRRDHNIERK